MGADQEISLTHDLNTRTTALILIAILLMSLTLNVVGIGFGLPQLTHWDERWIALPALNFLKFGEIRSVGDEPAFHYPHAYVYAQAGVFALTYLAEHARGNVTAIDDQGNEIHYRTKIHALIREGWWPVLYRSGRLLTALLGMLTVAMVFAVGQRLGSRKLGLIAAAALAVSPVFVANSHYLAVNVPAALLCTVILYILIGMRRERSGNTPAWRSLSPVLFTGLLSGLAFSTKYNAATIFLPVLLAIVLNRRGRRLLQSLLLAPAAMLAGFLFSMPEALAKPTIFLQDLAQQINYYRYDGHAFAERSDGLWAYIWFLFTDGMGIGLFLLAVAGIWLALTRYRPAGWYILLHVVVYLYQMGSTKAWFTRNLPLIMPFLALLAGMAAVWIFAELKKRWKALPDWSLAAGIAVLAIPSLVGSIYISSLLASPNNYLVARDWVLENLPEGSRLLVESADASAQVPFEPEDPYQVRYQPYAPTLPLGRLQQFDYVITWVNGPHRVDRYRYGRPPYIDGGYATIAAERGPQNLNQRWQDMQQHLELMKTFNAYELGTNGPTVKVWRVR